MSWMLYGANGYTGRLVATLARRRGERPLLAGRSPLRMATVSGDLGLDHVVVDLADSSGLRAALAGVPLVVNCAGPFIHTASAMVDACLDTGTHYLDITGEIDVFEAVYARDEDARQAGVIMLPGAGFDVVPTDCVAATLAQALPTAVELDLAFTLGGGVSPGTLKTAIDSAGSGGRVRVDGELRSVDIAHRRTVAEFPSGPRTVTAIPWGDISSAYRSTGIGTITTYTVVPGGDLIGQGHRLLAPALRMPAVRAVGSALVDLLLTGPSEQRQASHHAEVWGRVRDADGQTASMALTTPAPYSFTADSVVRAVTRLLAGGVSAGAHTPSSAFGADFVRELDGVRVGEIRRR